jgi:hypothetical protein
MHDAQNYTKKWVLNTLMLPWVARTCLLPGLDVEEIIGYEL